MTKKHFQTQLSDKKISEILQEDQAKEKEFQKRFQFYHGRVANRRKTEQMLKTSELGFLETQHQPVSLFVLDLCWELSTLKHFVFVWIQATNFLLKACIADDEQWVGKG